MTPAAHLSAAIEILDKILIGDPAAMTLTNWSRNSRYAGSRDRAAVRDIVYACLRRKRSFAHLLGQETGRGLVVAYAANTIENWQELFTGDGYAPEFLTPAEHTEITHSLKMSDPVRLNYPDFMDEALKSSLGANFEPVMIAMLDRAPVDLRVNVLRISRVKALEVLARDGITAELLEDVSTAIRVTENPRRVAQSQAYKTGLVELQDASSQAVTLFANAKPGMAVLDYCAGGGGKSLALYSAIEGQGLVVAHDIATVRMNDLPVRAARAKARITVAQPGHKALMPGRFDLVFVDAPCSGTGSWRRSPDSKWNLQPLDLDNLERVQSQILTTAAQYVRPGGTITYATCSVLDRENNERFSAFIAENPDFEFLDSNLFSPLLTGDGFFVARAIRNN